MNTRFRNQFLKDLKKVKNQSLKQKIKSTIIQIENAPSIQNIEQIKVLKGADNYFRVRIGDYRMGLFFDTQSSEVWIERFLHRKDIYKKFP
ncbi:type II toxin-antitoxin system RelE family toxin [Ekhidna sp.]